MWNKLELAGCSRGSEQELPYWELSTRGWTRVKTRKRRGGRRMPLRRKQEGISKEGEEAGPRLH